MATHTFDTRRTEIEGTLEMIREGWEYCDSQGEERVIPQAYYDRLQAELAALVAKGAPTGTRSVGVADSPLALHKRPAAGSRAANQFGEFTVKYATIKQVRFIHRLLETRDLSALESAGSEAYNLEAIRAQVMRSQVNKRAASAIIDLLLAQPEKATPARGGAAAAIATQHVPASDKQVALIKRLAAERDWNPTGTGGDYRRGNNTEADTITDVIAGEAIDKRDASAAIDYLFGCGKVAVRPAAEITRDHTGPWVHATTWNVYRVYYGRQSGRMLAKIWVPFEHAVPEGEPTGDWEYAGAADRFIDPARDHKMTRDEAAAWGQNSGNCCVCGADLDDPQSIDRGIGPVCWGKMS